MITFIFIIVFVLYAVLVAFLYTGWKRAIQVKPKVRQYDQFISVIVPVRNESANIGFLLDDLLDQSISSDKFEIIIVNDHSEDNTVEVVENKLNASSFFKIIHSAGHGKKTAITTGVRQAKGNLIVTTDADCRVTPTWLDSISNAFADDNIKMVVGPVKIKTNRTFFSKLQSLEFSSLIASGAATLEFRTPTMCNGANLAFRKDTFSEVNGYEDNLNIASGDDEFLLRKIAQKYPEGISFNNSPDGIVTTQPQQNLLQFISQRLRWAGKWKHHHDFKSKMLAFYIFIFHIVVLSSPVLFAVQLVDGYTLIILLILKLIVEFIFLSNVTAWLNIRWHWLSFILLQFLYPVYAICIGLASLFLRPSWKGRK